MSQKHARNRGRWPALVPALWLAAVLAVLFISSLLAIVLLLHQLLQLALDVAGQLWNV